MPKKVLFGEIFEVKDIDDVPYDLFPKLWEKVAGYDRKEMEMAGLSLKEVKINKDGTVSVVNQ